MNTVTRYTSEGKKHYTVQSPYNYRPIMIVLSLLAILVVLAIALILDTVSVNAMELDLSQDDNTPVATYYAHDKRPDACRTWNVGGYDATDGISCGIGLDDTEMHSKQHGNNGHIIVSDDSVLPISDNPEVIQDNPTNDAPNNDGKKHCNQGKGNGSEGCDPGNSNHNQVSNDEPTSNQRGNGW